MVLGLLCTAGGFLSFFQLIRLAGSVRATLITYTAPLVAIAAGVLFLQESVTSAVTVQGLSLAVPRSVGCGSISGTR